MFCSKCGNELKEGSIFCSKCGIKVVDVDANDTHKGTAVSEANMPNNSERTPKINIQEQKRNSYMAILSLVVIVILIMCFSRSCSSKTNNQAESDEARAISFAKSIISEDLKDPASVTWNSADIEDRDNNGRYLVKIDYSATNGFGGRTREVSYVALMLTDEGANYSTYMPYVPTRDYSALVVDASINIMKKAIDWGEESDDEKVTEQGSDNGILEKKEMMSMAENLVDEILDYSKKEYNLTYIYNTQIIYNEDNNYLVSVRFYCPQQAGWEGSCLVALRNKNGNIDNYVAEAFGYDYDFESHVEQYKVIFEEGHELRDLYDVICKIMD